MLPPLPTFRQLNATLLCGGLLLCNLGCGGEQEMPADTTTDTPPSVTTAARKTQALLLTQAFAYEDSRKDSIAGAYIAQTSLVVPSTLSPQSKWVMFEGPVLENDLVAYRYYLDNRHRFDIYGKRVRDLVMDTVSWDYHNVMNWGSDVLKVGSSLGSGSPAIYFQDSVYTFSNPEVKRVSILEREGDVAAIRTQFEGLSLGGERFDFIQDWSLASGTHAMEVALTISKGKLPQGARLATGIVNHDTAAKRLTSADGMVLYTWGPQSYHGDLLGMAVLANSAYGPEIVADPVSHLMLFQEGLTEVTYAFTSGWELGVVPFTTEAAFVQSLTLNPTEK